VSSVVEPLKQGVVFSDRPAREPIKKMELAAGSTMLDWLRDGVWFTHAVCHTHLPVGVDPLANLLGHRPDIDVRAYLHAIPFFSGFGYKPELKHWDHCVLWTPTVYWPLIRSHLDGCLFRHSSGEYRSWFAERTVPDSPLLYKSATLPAVCRVPVQILGLSCDAWRLEFYDSLGPTTPTAVEYTPLLEITK